MSAVAGCYFEQERVWTVIAASTIDEDGTEHVNPEPIGQHELTREWRFLDREDADAWACRIGAESPHPIADLPHRCNGWVVQERIVLDRDPERWPPGVQEIWEAQRR